MCLAIPGRIKSIEVEDPVLRSGKVDFGGVAREVNLAYVPEATVGDYVIVHVGFAISKLDEEEARQVFAYLREMGELEEELGESPPSARSGSPPPLQGDGISGSPLPAGRGAGGVGSEEVA